MSVDAARCSQDETFTTLVILPFRQPSDEQLIALADALCANWTLRVIRRPSPTRPGACFQSALRLLQELSIPGRALPDTVLDALNRSFRANTTLRSVSIGGDNFGDAGLSRIVSGLSSSSSIEALPVHVLAVAGSLRKGEPYAFVYHCACSLSILRVVGSPLLVAEICCGCFETRRRLPVRLAFWAFSRSRLRVGAAQSFRSTARPTAVGFAELKVARNLLGDSALTDLCSGVIANKVPMDHCWPSLSDRSVHTIRLA